MPNRNTGNLIKLICMARRLLHGMLTAMYRLEPASYPGPQELAMAEEIDVIKILVMHKSN